MHDTNKIIYEFFSDDDFLRISNAIKQAEKTTSAEIKISVKEKRNFAERKKSLHELAAHDFKKFKMGKTKDATGVLIFLLLSEKSFYIYADSGVTEHLSNEILEKIRDKMQDEFKRGNFTEGIILGINDLASVLSEKLPILPDDVNELSNAVEID